MGIFNMTKLYISQGNLPMLLQSSKKRLDPDQIKKRRIRTKKSPDADKNVKCNIIEVEKALYFPLFPTVAPLICQLSLGYEFPV